MSEEVLEKKNKKPVVIIAVLIAVIAIVAILIVSLTSKSGNANSYQSKLDEAQRYVDELNYELAIASFEEAIAIEPKAVDAYIGLADVYVAMDDYDSAMAVIEDALNNVDSDNIAVIEEYKANLEVIIQTSNDADNEDGPRADTDELIIEIKDFSSGTEDLRDDIYSIYYGQKVDEEILKENDFYGTAVGLYMLTYEETEALCRPVIDDLLQYIAWLEMVQDNETYSCLYSGSLLGFGATVIPSLIDVDSRRFIPIRDAYSYLYFLYIKVGDFDEAYALKEKLYGIYGADFVHLEEYSSEWGDTIVTYDRYDREIERIERWQGERETVVYKTEYNEYGRIISSGAYTEDGTCTALSRFILDETGRTVQISYKDYLYNPDDVNESKYEYLNNGECNRYYYSVQDEEWYLSQNIKYNEYGTIVEENYID